MQRLGWQLDYLKFRLYLTHRYNVAKVLLFMGLIPANFGLYDQLRAWGYTIIFKPTIRYSRYGISGYKGNVDVDLTVHAAAIEFGNYDQAIIVSSDGDFLCLHRYLHSKQKLRAVMVPGPDYSRLLEDFSDQLVRIYTLRKALEKT